MFLIENSCHCEERSDEAISQRAQDNDIEGDCFARKERSLAMTQHLYAWHAACDRLFDPDNGLFSLHNQAINERPQPMKILRLVRFANANPLSGPRQ